MYNTCCCTNGIAYYGQPKDRKKTHRLSDGTSGIRCESIGRREGRSVHTWNQRAGNMCVCSNCVLPMLRMHVCSIDGFKSCFHSAVVLVLFLWLSATTNNALFCRTTQWHWINYYVPFNTQNLWDLHNNFMNFLRRDSPNYFFLSARENRVFSIYCLCGRCCWLSLITDLEFHSTPSKCYKRFAGLADTLDTFDINVELRWLWSENIAIETRCGTLHACARFFC